MAHIIVVGSINTDLVIRTRRIPARGETLIGHSFTVTGGGKGANQAVAAARLSRSKPARDPSTRPAVAIVGKVGQDSFGQQAMTKLEAEGIDLRYVGQSAQAASGVALIAVEETGENCILVAPGANGLLTPSDVAQAGEVLTGARMLLTQLEVPLDTVRFALEQARRVGVTTLLNPAPMQVLPPELYPLVDYLVPNQSEAELLTHISVHNEASARQAADRLHERGVAHVLITLGRQGCFVSGPDQQMLVSAQPIAQIVDTVAAGDTFCGALAVALAEGRALLDAVRFANVAAGLSITKSGAQASIPDRAAVDSLFTEPVIF